MIRKHRSLMSATLLGLMMTAAVAEGSEATAGADTPQRRADDVPAAPKPLTAAQQKKADEKQAREDKKAADAKAKADAAAAKPAKTPAVEQNGVTRPASGKTKAVWDMADKMSQELQKPVERAALTEVLIAAPHEIVIGTIHTQYGKWRKFHGLVTPKAPAAPAPAANAEPEAPATA